MERRYTFSEYIDAETGVAGARNPRIGATESLRLPRRQPGVAAQLTPKRRSGDLPNRLFRYPSPNGTYDLTGM